MSEVIEWEEESPQENKIPIHPALNFMINSDSKDLWFMSVGISKPVNKMRKIVNNKGEEKIKKIGEGYGLFLLTEFGEMNPSDPKFKEIYTLTTLPTLTFIRNRYSSVEDVVNVVVEVEPIKNIKIKEGITENNDPLPVTTTYTTPSTLLTLKEQWEYYIDLPEKYLYNTLSLWDLGTYLFPLFSTYPYISFYGFKDTGKSKCLLLSSLLSFNGCLSVGISASALFRGCDSLRWSLHFDENNLFKKAKGGEYPKRSEEILPIILQGYRAGAKVPRMSGNNEKKSYTMELFEVYCPKMFASNYEDDEIFGSRAIQIIMKPTISDKGNRDIKIEDGKWKKIRTDCLVWAFKNWKNVKEIYNELKNETKLKNRDWELIKPLLAIAKVISNELFEEQRDFLEKYLLERKQEEKIEDYSKLLLLSLNLLSDNEFHTTHEIIEALGKVLGEDTPDWITPKWVGFQIKKLGIKFLKRRVTKGMEYSFDENSIEDCQRRYGMKKEENKIFKCKENEHFGKCSICSQENQWLDHAFGEDWDTNDEKFICENCAKKIEGETSKGNSNFSKTREYG